MSTNMSAKIIVRGNAKTLQEFAYYFEGEYDDEELGGSIKDYYSPILSGNCYIFDEYGNYLWIDCEKLSNKFPNLKFDYIEECSDGNSVSLYRICLNGKLIDLDEGNSFAFGKYPDEYRRCAFCDCELEESASLLCEPCEEFGKETKQGATGKSASYTISRQPKGKNKIFTT